MAYFKYRAYDFDVKYNTDAESISQHLHEGAVQAENYAEVALYLHQIELVPKEISIATYQEYKLYQKREALLNRFKQRLPKTSLIKTGVKRPNYLLRLVLLAPIALILLLLLAYYASLQ